MRSPSVSSPSQAPRLVRVSEGEVWSVNGLGPVRAGSPGRGSESNRGQLIRSTEPAEDASAPVRVSR
jgi:hypothetical protein